MRIRKHSAECNPNSPKKSRASTDNPRGKHLPIRTLGEVFPDGGSIELIRKAGTASPCLLVCDGENRRTASELEFRGRVYLPADIDPSFLRAIRLPSKYGDFESTAELFRKVRELLTSCGLPEEVALGTTHFIFPTWFLEFLPIAPCLSITGARPEALLLMQLIGCLVRHPLPLGDVTQAGLCSLPMDLQLTLLIDQPRLGRSAWGLLRASNHRGAYIPRKDSLVNLFCAKVVYFGDAVTKDCFGDETLRVNLPPSRGRMPVLDEKGEKEIFDEFQAKMLAYRCRNLAKVRESTFDLPEFTSGIRILARVLGAPMVDAPELQAGLGPLLRAYQDQTRASRWLDLRCIVIEAALHHCHKQPREKVHVGEITKTVIAILKGRGEATQVEAKEIGDVLRMLGLFAKRDSAGYAIRLDDRVCGCIHELAYRYDVAMMQEGVAPCSHCREKLAADYLGDQDASRLKRGLAKA